jgi:hypothetical protein
LLRFASNLTARMKNGTANWSKERGGGGVVFRSGFVMGFRFITRSRFVYGSGFVTWSGFVKGFGFVTLWIGFLTLLQLLFQLRQIGHWLLRTARVALKFSMISQSRGMMVLHLGDSLDFAVNTRRRVLATRVLVVQTHRTPICLSENLNWKPSYSKILRIWQPTFTLMGVLLYGP